MRPEALMRGPRAKPQVMAAVSVSFAAGGGVEQGSDAEAGRAGS